VFAIVEEPIDVAALISAAQRPDCGAISTFVGTTRLDESKGASVEYLEYEAYRPMADRKLKEIGAEIEKRWDVREVSIVHRLGRVEPGEASVAIAVAAPRRGPAFEASRYAIERIKETVPIWKREVWSDGYVWVGSQVGTREEFAQRRKLRRVLEQAPTDRREVE
jgi:molybdopterin synthase catalytic subunit